MYKFINQNKIQILRFVLAGLIASSFNYIIYNLIFLNLQNILFASVGGYFIGIIISFILAKIWVFRNQARIKLGKSFFIFVLIYILGGLEMSLLIRLFFSILDSYKIAWLFGAFIAALNNYLLPKYFVFKD